jgi:hypothetical protein
MSSPNPISNSSAIRADRIEVWNGQKRKYEEVGTSIVGLAPDDLNSIELLAQAIDNNPMYFESVAAGLSAKADKSDVDADLALLTSLVNTKATTSALTSTAASLQAQLDTKASSSALASLSSTVQTKQDALLQVPADSGTEELLTGAFLKGIYGEAPVHVSTNANILDPNDTKLGHIRVRLDAAYQASLALKAETYTRAQVDSSLHGPQGEPGRSERDQRRRCHKGGAVYCELHRPELSASNHSLWPSLARAAQRPAG